MGSLKWDCSLVKVQGMLTSSAGEIVNVYKTP